MTNAAQFHLFEWIVLALACGFVVGLEREFRGHEAGVRTYALVCAGAALFGRVSFLHGSTSIAANVVQGIGFLGAGLVFHQSGGVRGITTAATIWVMAAVGLLVASEAWLSALLVTAAIVVMLELEPFSSWILLHGRPRPEPHAVPPESME
ncbi:MAG: MgtC/SapB family protein [Tepidiformaceae bacterium]